MGHTGTGTRDLSAFHAQHGGEHVKGVGIALTDGIVVYHGPIGRDAPVKGIAAVQSLEQVHIILHGSGQIVMDGDALFLLAHVLPDVFL